MAWLLLCSFIIGLAFFALRGLMDELYRRLLLRNTIKKFKSEMEKLITRRDLVLKEVEEANNKTEKVNNDVLEWPNEVEKLKEEAKKLKKIERETGSTSLSTEQKHQLYDEILTKAKMLNTKYTEFEPFCNPSPSTKCLSFENIEWLTSKKEAQDILLESLYDDNSYIVGLHGVPGSGKTKLVKAVAEKAKVSNIIDAFIYVKVPKHQAVQRIKNDIVERLNAELTSKKQVLVILDKVRAKLELLHIGIPPRSKRCKVIFTTRSLQVCDLMQCDRVIALNPLSKEEAWMWFRNHAGLDDDNSSSNILNVAREVADECKGIPQTIKEVGSSLRRKPIEDWKASLDRLRCSIPTARYHIFLSFRGEDTRYSFTRFLYDALCREGFKTFMDEEGLQSGDQISDSLVEAIQASRLSIVVFSENYAYSGWCLDELVTIFECMRTNNQLVWPIFYKVEPSDVRHQKNSYGEAMDKHKNKFRDDPEKVRKWKLALSEIANLSGNHYKTGYEHDFIQKIVKETKKSKDRLCL